MDLEVFFQIFFAMAGVGTFKAPVLSHSPHLPHLTHLTHFPHLTLPKWCELGRNSFWGPQVACLELPEQELRGHSIGEKWGKRGKWGK